MTKIILVGHPGSQIIVPASKYLTKKYLPGFDITYLNYTGPIEGWAAFVRSQLVAITDTFIIFSLDDYLISGPIDMEKYRQAESEINREVVCVKLCQSTQEEHKEYPATTQYCIWDREYLIWLLGQVLTPWEFEIHGSEIFTGKSLLRPCLEYFTNSSLSSRWKGVNITGLRKDDIVEILDTRLLSVFDISIPDLNPGMTAKQVLEMYNKTGIMLKQVVPIEPKIVCFGASGFLGHALIDRFIALGRTNIIAVARNEGNLVALKEKFPSVQIMVGDIADPWIVKKAMVGADEIFLLSAMKHVGLAEVDVKSCIQTNIVGTMNVINESLVTKPKVLLFVSSDKAAQGTGIYGCSKKIGERLMVEAERMNPATKYRVVRYGNILYSSGSVLCKWREKMQSGQEVVVTDENATRFFWPIDEAVNLIFTCIDSAKDASPFVAGMKSIRIGDLLEAMMSKYGRVPVKTIGLQPGENRHEIITEDLPDSFSSERFTKEEILELI